MTVRPSLDMLIRETERHLAQVLDEADPSGVRVAWTGGKDSTVVLFIWRALLEQRNAGPARAINLDTGHKFPEVLAFRDGLAEAWSIDLHVARPLVDPATYPVAKDVVRCCAELKVEPLKRAVIETGTTHLLTGIRADEHPDRAARPVREHRTEPEHTVVHPILSWTETDIWALHTRFDVPHCPLYDQGYRSLGCVPCTTHGTEGSGERAGRNRTKEAAMQTLTDLGYF